MALTDQQSLIISTFTSNQNVLVNACPGSGKTYTLVQAVNALPSNVSILALAYNKSIATNLQSKFIDSPYAKASTTHSDAFSAFPSKRPKVDNSKLTKLARELYPDLNFQLRDTACTLCNIMKDQALGLTAPPTYEEALYFIDHFSLNIEVPEDWFSEPLDSVSDDVFVKTQRLALNTVITTATHLLDTSTSLLDTIDFNDMLYIPIKLKYNFRPYRYILCDEVQDFSPLQIAYLQHRTRPDTTLLLVGDKKQSAYGFRGADAQAFAKLQTAFSCTELPMNKTFRCPITVCDEANKIFPDALIPMTPTQGTVSHLEQNDFLSHPWHYLDQDSILMCRTNAPMFFLATTFLRKGIPVRVQPRVVNSFLSLIKRQKATTLPELTTRLQKNEERDIREATTDLKIAMIEDKYEVIYQIISESASIQEVLDTLNSLLTSDKGPLFTSIHSGKGLEARNAFIYRSDLLPHPMARKPWEQEQERNLQFIAVTRAIENLIYI